MKRTLAEFALASGGRLFGPDRAYTSVSSDTRTLRGGELFVALTGPRFNANDFVSAAQAAGAAGALVESQQTNASIPQIVVPDVLAALTKAANAWREKFKRPVVGVAGSNGKTTVKEMTAAILSQAGSTLATKGNLNNHIGVPLTLMRLEPDQQFAVIEIGANNPGEVAHLVKVARPTIGLITNAGAEHLEGFGSLEGVAKAEGEMVAGLAPDATAVINADDEFAPLWRGMTPARVSTFGIQHPADFSAADLRTEITSDGFLTRFTLKCPLGEAPIEMRLAGRHNVLNSLAAAAAAAAAGVSLANIVAGLATMRAVQGRLQFKIARSGAWIIDDSYNANPSSVRAGIDVLADLQGKRWLVLGMMGELGDFAESSHTEMGAYARQKGIERFFGIGQLTSLAVESFGSGAQWFADADSLAQALHKEASADVRMLIKGSRSNRLERIVDALTGVAGSSSH